HKDPRSLQKYSSKKDQSLPDVQVFHLLCQICYFLCYKVHREWPPSKSSALYPLTAVHNVRVFLAHQQKGMLLLRQMIALPVLQILYSSIQIFVKSELNIEIKL